MKFRFNTCPVGFDEKVVRDIIKLINELAKNPAYERYLEEGKMSLIDSRFSILDVCLRNNLIVQDD